jgi:hypothetical protein
MNLPLIRTWTRLKEGLNGSVKLASASSAVGKQHTPEFHPPQSLANASDPSIQTPPEDKPAPLNAVHDERRQMCRPLPVPDVVEGKGSESDWAKWEELSQQVAPTADDPAVEHESQTLLY